MEGTYEVMLGSKRIGTVSVKRQGLYWLFDSQCHICGEVMYDLILILGDTRYNLGILSPENGIFRRNCKWPIKKLEQGSPHFLLQPRHEKMNEHFVPVYPLEPFRYLQFLESSYLAIRHGEIGLGFEEKIMEKSQINA